MLHISLYSVNLVSLSNTSGISKRYFFTLKNILISECASCSIDGNLMKFTTNTGESETNEFKAS